MTLLPSSRGASIPSATSEPLRIVAAAGIEVRLEGAVAGRGAPVEILAVVVLDARLRIGPLRLLLVPGSRFEIVWPEPLLATDAAGAAREIQLSAEARRQVADALARHVAFGDEGSERP